MTDFCPCDKKKSDSKFDTNAMTMQRLSIVDDGEANSDLL
jgi:hypothetical protein